MKRLDRQNFKSRVRGSSYDETTRDARQECVVADAQMRFLRMGAIFLGVLLIIALRLVWLQVIDGPRLSAKAASNHTNRLVLHAKRGTIYDRNGNVLATSEECKTIYANPKEVADVDKTAKLLAEFLGGTPEDYKPTLQKKTTFAYVQKKVDNPVATKLKAALRKEKLTGIYYLSDMKRVYPYGAVAAQILGIVGNDGKGKTGLELYYDKILSGTDGRMTMAVGADGVPIAGGASTIEEAKNGQDIVLSLDVNIQQVAEQKITEAVEKYTAESGMVMVSDPKSGEILAACSTPLLQPQTPNDKVQEALNFKMVASAYEPGSIFKIMTMSMALEKGVVTPDTVFSVPPSVKVGSDNVRDDDRRSYTMDMSVSEILRRSSNTGSVLVGRKIGNETFMHGVKKFGIGSKTGIDFPGEVAGLVPKDSDYNDTRVGAMSFGQATAVPMVQMMRAASSVANKGVMTTPHFLISKNGQKVDWSGSNTRVMSEETAAQMTKMMQLVVEKGTGKAAHVDGFEVAGKTGTGQQATSGGYKNSSYLSSLIGFANASNPSVMVYVGLNGTSYLAASSAAPVFSSIMSEALSDMGIQPVAQK